MGNVLRTNCLLSHVVGGGIEGEIEVTERRGRSKRLLDDLKGKRGYCKLKEEALDRVGWRFRSGRGDGLVVRMMDESVTPIWLHWNSSDVKLYYSFLFLREMPLCFSGQQLYSS
jgi:hypothetical protein